MRLLSGVVREEQAARLGKTGTNEVKQMEYRVLGATGIKVSALGYGGSSLGSVFHDIDEAAGIRSVHIRLRTMARPRQRQCWAKH